MKSPPVFAEDGGVASKHCSCGAWVIGGRRHTCLEPQVRIIPLVWPVCAPRTTASGNHELQVEMLLSSGRLGSPAQRCPVRRSSQEQHGNPQADAPGLQAVDNFSPVQLAHLAANDPQHRTA